MFSTETSLYIFVCATIVCVAAHVRSKQRSKYWYPPGPAGWPIVGNLPAILSGHWYETFSAWQKEYGDVVYAPIAGKPAYIVNSNQIAEKLLGKGNLCSGRPYSRMVNSLMSWGWNPGLLEPTKEWAQIRLHFRQAIGPQILPRYRPVIYDQTAQLLKTLVNYEGHPEEIVDSAIGSIINRLAYGEEIFHEHGQTILDANREAMNLLNYTFTQFWFVDVLAPLKYIPEWFPGATFQKIAKRSSELSDYIRNQPWKDVLERTTRPEGYEDCIATRGIEKSGPSDALRDAIAIMYAGGASTTNATFMIFLACVMFHPDVQRKIHEEMDRVVGDDRLPKHDDKASLHYLQAAWKEAARWRPTAPINFPHVTTVDQMNDEYWMPKGTLVFTNTGFMLRDPRIWDSPNDFNPDRFLEPYPKDRPDPSVVFGYGRRACPGRFFAEETGFCMATALLWAFDLECVDKNMTLDDIKFVDAAICPPLPFNIRFRPRNEKISQILLDL